MRRSVISRGWLVVPTLVSLSFHSPLLAQQDWEAVAPDYPRTASENSGFERHTRHIEMWDYLRALRAQTTGMRLGTYGETREGRQLPYAIFGRPLTAEPWEAWALDRPIVVFAANVHGGERTFREGLLILMRDFATPGTEAYELLDRVTVVVAPQINPDGFEVSERGQRGNAWGIDLNRDYIKLEHPSIADYVKNVIGAWRPHLFVDGHNGGSDPYNLNYQCPSHVDPDPRITALCDGVLFPLIDARLATEGFKSWYYQEGDEEEWTTGGSQARIGRNYGGFVNSVGILFEAPSGQSLEEGARAGYLGYLTAAKWSAENPDMLKGLIDDARRETIALGSEPSGQLAVRMEYQAEDELVDYEIVGGGGGTGQPRDVIQVTGARLMKKPVATVLRDRPWAYLLPRDAIDAVALLLGHGITVERLTAGDSLTVQAYTMADVSHERQYNHAAATRIEVGEVINVTRTFPPGTYVVPTAQYLGRLAAHMLEAETDDNVIYWNRMEAWIPRPTEPAGDAGRDGPPLVPIYKIMSPTALQAEIVEEVTR